MQWAWGWSDGGSSSGKWSSPLLGGRYIAVILSRWRPLRCNAMQGETSVAHETLSVEVPDVRAEMCMCGVVCAHHPELEAYTVCNSI